MGIYYLRLVRPQPTNMQSISVAIGCVSNVIGCMPELKLKPIGRCNIATSFSIFRLLHAYWGCTQIRSACTDKHIDSTYSLWKLLLFIFVYRHWMQRMVRILYFKYINIRVSNCKNYVVLTNNLYTWRIRKVIGFDKIFVLPTIRSS